MKQIRFFIIWAVLSCSFSAGIHAQDSLSVDKYATRILLNEKQLEFSGTTLISKKRLIIKLLTREGLKAASVGLYYRSDIEKLKIKNASIQLPNGKIIKLKSSDITDIPYSESGNNYFSDRHKVTLTFPQATLGSVIDYTIETVTDLSLLKGDFSDKINLRPSVPVDTFFWSLTLDKKSRPRAYFHFEHTDSLIPEIVENEKTIRYFIKMNNLSAYDGLGREPSPYMLVSTWKNWNDFIQWWIPLYKNKLDVSDSIRFTVDRLINNKINDFEKAKAITEWVKDRIRYVAVEYGTGGFEPRRASYTFTQKYGDCKDKSVLAISMLKVAGIEAYPVLVSTFSKVVTDFPAHQFNHAVICVKIDTSMIFFDPTNTSYDFGYIHYSMTFDPQAVIKDDAIIFVKPVPYFGQHEQTDYLWLRLDDKVINGTMKIYAQGIVHHLYRGYFDKPASRMRESFMKIVMRSGKLLFADDIDSADYKIMNGDSSFLYIRFTCKPVLFEHGDMKFINLDFFMNEPNAVYRDNFKRKKAFQMPPSKKNIFAEFIPDSGYTVISVPTPKSLNNLFGYFSRNYSFENNVIKITAVESRRHIDFTLNDYDTEKVKEFLEYEEYENSSLNDFIVLKKIKK